VRGRIERSVGRSFFGADPRTYDAVRPGHPPEVYDLLGERCGLRPGSRVLEVGPGTGQATGRLLDLAGGPLVAIEPDPRLADFLRERFGGRIDVRVATLEDADLGTCDYDLAAAASSFHWVEESAGLEKLRGALRPGGWIAIWWTSFGDELRPDPFRLALDPLFADVPVSPSGPAEGRPGYARDAELRLAALAASGFEDASYAEVHWAHMWDTTGIRGLYSTFSPLSALDPERREELLDSVARIAEDDFGGRVERPLVTSLYTARKPG
jgi:SAM-dependent methyltransferase